MEAKQSVAIIGAGAVGGILGGHLLRAGQPVIMIDRQPLLVKHLDTQGLQVHGPATQQTYGPFQAFPHLATTDYAVLTSARIIFICTKTTVLKTVTTAMRPYCRPDAILVSCHNGIDPEELLVPLANRARVLRMVINYAGNVLNHGHYHMNWFRAPNYLGSLEAGDQQAALQITHLLNQARLATQQVSDIKKFAYEKTALNATLCPICALTTQNMGEAIADPDTYRLSRNILQEARLVGEAQGWHFEQSLQDWLAYLEKGGPHKPSMAVDMERHQQTEIDFINGKICELGRQLGIATPYNDSMLWCIRARQRLLCKPVDKTNQYLRTCRNLPAQEPLHSDEQIRKPESP